MNYAGKFDAKLSAEGSGLHSNGPVHVETVHAAHVPPDAIIVPDAHLLFHGEFKRSGVDLILSKDAQELVLHDYFKGEKRVALASPDGARLTGDIVNALSGHVEYAQADGSASVSKIIGHVTKLVGTATAIRNGVSIILNNGDNVEKGDVVESGADSRLGITFIDGTVFGLSSNARMVLNEMVYDPNGSNNSSLLSLVAGTMTFVAGDTAKHGDMKIDTPVATMGIRGTAVLVQINFVAPTLAPGVVPDPGSLQALLPELHVQVVVEPDGTVGSLIMYEKSTLTPLAVADKAGVQINITNGIVSQSSNPLSPELQKLIDEVFTLRFTDNSNTKTTVVQNDSIVPKDGTFGFHLPDGTIVTAVFSTTNSPLLQNNSPNVTPITFFVPLKVALDQTGAKEGMAIHATGGGTNSFAWQVSSDNGKDWATVSSDATYTPTENDEGKLLQLVVNNASQTFSLGTVAEDPAEKAAISLDGLTGGHALDGTLVTATVTDPDAPASSSIIYTWMVDGTTVASGAGLNTYTPIETEGKALTVSVSFTDTHGNAETGTQSAGTVAPVAEAPTLTIASHTVSIAEEAGTALGISVTAHDGDDVLSIAISNVPNDATLTYFGADEKIHTLTPIGGVYTLTVDQLNGLTLHAGEQTGPVTLSVTATNTTTGETASVNDTISLTVNPIQENPIFSGATATTVNEQGGEVTFEAAVATHAAAISEQGGVVTLGASVATHDADDGPISVTIAGLAHDLSTFNGGSYDSESGTWSGTAAEFNALTFKAGEDGIQHLTITATTGGAEAGTTVESYTLTVNPIQENPIFSGAVTTAASEQGGVVTLGAAVATHDADDGAISVSISGLAHDLSTFNGGSYDSEGGTWSGTAAEFNALTFKAGEDGTQHLTITATTGGAEAGITVESYTLTVNPIQENPIFSGAVTTAANEQGGVVTLGASVAAHDADDGAVSVTIAGLAHDLSSFNGGSYDSESGTWSGTAAEFNALTFKAGEDGTQHLTITATTGGAEAGITVENYTLTVNPIQENPIFSGAVTTAANEQGGVVTLGASVAAHDADDGAVSVTIAGLAHDLSSFNGGSYDSESGTWSGTAAEFNALTFKAGEDGTQHLTITATTGGAEAGITVESYTLTVNPIQENPIFSGAVTTAANEQGGVVTLGASVATHDADDGPISVTIAGLAHDLSTFNGGSYDSESGTWSGTAAEFNALTFKAGEDGTQHLTITATTGGAEAGSTVENYTLTVNPIQENPIFSGATATTVNEQGSVVTFDAAVATHAAAVSVLGGVVTLGATVATHDADDGPISVTIAGLAHDLSTFNGGSYDSESGTWSGTAAEFNALTFKAGEDGIQHLTITATTGGAEAGTTVESYTLTVNPIQENPIFSGAVTTAASEQGGVVTLGAAVATHDADDGAISVSISGLAHDLSTFNGGSYDSEGGTWSGTAAEFNALTFKAGEDGIQHLTITATTGGAEAGSTVENYTLTVRPVAEAASLAGTVTVVSGGSDSAIPLTIVATPFDGDDNLSVTITGVPSDASLNHGTLNPDGSYTLTLAQLSGLKYNSDEDNTVLHVVVTSSEGASSTTSSVDIAVSVDSSLTIAAGDTFHLNGGTLTDHSITVSGTLIGFGTVTASNGALANIIDNGLVEASSSHVLDLNANITGNGTLELTNNTTMEIAGSVASTLKTLFAVGGGSTGELILDSPGGFHSPITGFGGNDIIDLHSSKFAYLGTGPTLLNSSHTAATLVSGTSTETISLVSMTSTETVITVTEGGTTATIKLEGNYNGHSFTFSSDGSGGTQFVDPLAIDSGAMLEVPGASADNVLFVNNGGISGTLVLDDAAAFSGQISGFAGTSTTSDAIDLKSVTFDSETKWTYTANNAGTGGALTIYEGVAVVDTIEFTGNYTTASFKVQSDSNGGTLVTDPPTSSPAVYSVVMQDPGPLASSSIVASAPDQTLSGTAASDTFVFNFANVGHATVTDFHPESDTLQFKSPIFANALGALSATHDDGHGNTVVAIDSHDTITLAGVLKAQLHASDFHIV